jgi:hypothetical protein
MTSEPPREPNEPPREQEQSIKARKREIFEEEHHAGGPRRPFAEYLAETPPMMLSTVVRTALGAVFVLVVLLLLAAIFTIPSPRGRHSSAPKGPAHASGKY